MFKTRLLPVLVVSTLCGFSAAHAQTTNCNTSKSGMDAIDRLSQRENCLNDRARSWQQKSQAEQQARQQRIDNLRNKYENAPANEKERIAKQMQNEQNKLTSWKQKQSEQLNKWRNAPSDQRQRVNNLANKARGDFNNFLNGN
ncbi:hypothetical protein [Kozakia baliensis]|uniref:hypothetical protein n=1 Tax=Kozakia baliensis TaxID=153496 RepID=UPI00049544CA|nr:hypothetical protein [Kozakia baliensis]AOX20468.1 hypothetical protein A0U90_09325 [Kozakia baliensis]